MSQVDSFAPLAPVLEGAGSPILEPIIKLVLSYEVLRQIDLTTNVGLSDSDILHADRVFVEQLRQDFPYVFNGAVTAAARPEAFFFLSFILSCALCFDQTKDIRLVMRFYGTFD